MSKTNQQQQQQGDGAQKPPTAPKAKAPAAPGPEAMVGDDITSICIAGEQFDPDDTGVFTIPAHLVQAAAGLGLKLKPADEKPPAE